MSSCETLLSLLKSSTCIIDSASSIVGGDSRFWIRRGVPKFDSNYRRTSDNIDWGWWHPFCRSRSERRVACLSVELFGGPSEYLLNPAFLNNKKASVLIGFKEGCIYRSVIGYSYGSSEFGTFLVRDLPLLWDGFLRIRWRVWFALTRLFPHIPYILLVLAIQEFRLSSLVHEEVFHWDVSLCTRKCGVMFYHKALHCCFIEPAQLL